MIVDVVQIFLIIFNVKVTKIQKAEIQLKHFTQKLTSDNLTQLYNAFLQSIF